MLYQKKKKLKSVPHSVVLINEKHHMEPDPLKAEIAKTGYARFKYHATVLDGLEVVEEAVVHKGL